MLRGGPVTTALGAERAGAELSAPDAGSAPRALAAASTQARTRGRPRMLMLLSSPSTYPPDATTPCTRALHAPGGLGGPLGLGELALDEVEPSLPEARVGEIDAHDRSQLLRRTRASGRQQLELAGHQLRAGLLVALVHRQRHQLAVGIRIDVARAADEVRNV